MNNKERYLKFIKDFKEINISNILKEINMDNSSFYTERYSLENMQKINDEFRKRLCEFYSELNNEFILDTKESNINFVKEVSNISPINICKDLSIQSCDIYALRASENKYELVVNTIKERLKETFNKYSK